MQRAGWIISLIAVLVIAAPTSFGEDKRKESPAVVRDGQHDFDFVFGRWKVHNRRLLKPLTGSNEWVEFEGTWVAKPIWEGRGNMDEFVVDAPSGRIYGTTVRLYNQKTGEWSLYWANAANGEFSLPATVGHFTHGRGEFFDREEYNGRPIMVRYIWSNITPNSARWEQAFSVDGGKTWETNWVTENTRVKE